MSLVLTVSELYELGLGLGNVRHRAIPNASASTNDNRLPCYSLKLSSVTIYGKIWKLTCRRPTAPLRTAREHVKCASELRL
ncbi:hypothetical protein CYMTET_19131 [Cymbomonas tetramitiformis]|uniref:Uncharacterized protein n=1 Tax=Cymbomonas tetramitiformis TaxID=36881 RepID=A0AAE0G774_9CHLO|nr:hypothetical protein CYMTET_19131 [Cymbomonas tetramitiformis]